MNDIEEEDVIFDKLLKPYIFIIKMLSILLILSIIGNIYLTTKNVNITLTANKNIDSDFIYFHYFAQVEVDLIDAVQVGQLYL